MDTSTLSIETEEVKAVFPLYEAASCPEKAEAGLSVLPIVMRNLSQQFLWFLHVVTKRNTMRRLRETLDQGNLDFVYIDLAIQVLATESGKVRAACISRLLLRCPTSDQDRGNLRNSCSMVISY